MSFRDKFIIPESFWNWCERHPDIVLLATMIFVGLLAVAIIAIGAKLGLYSGGYGMP